MNIQYKTAVLAKEKGFDLECRHYFDIKKFGEKPVGFFGKLNANILTTLSPSGKVVSCNYISCPLQSELQQWLREKHEIHVSVEPQYNLTDESINEIEFNDTWCATLENISKEKLVATNILCLAATKNIYEEALEEGLYEALKLIKDET